MGDVVRLGTDRETKHLNKILDKLASAQKLKATFIAGKKPIDFISERITEINEEYNFFKKAYEL